jgi:hypothetical protein
MSDVLQTISESGNPPVSRIKDAKSAYEVWETLRRADAVSAYDRSKIDAAYDNERPYDERALINAGQGYRVNVSWGFAKQVLDTAMAGYTDIINAPQTFFSCPTMYGPMVERDELENVIAQEVTATIRSWRNFFPTYLRLCNSFIKHGVGIALFNDEWDWRWKATDMSDFKLPRKTEIGQENIDCAACLRFYSPTQLYQLIKDEEIARINGFNVEACRRAIISSVNNNNNHYQFRQYDWEKLEVELRNNDLFFTTQAANQQSIRVVHLWVTEFDGKVSHLMISDDNGVQDFLFKKIGRFDNSYEAYTVFTYGVGTNGYYHGVRGQGYDVFAINGALNRAYCSLLEIASFGSAPTFQPKDETALQEMQFIPNGIYNLLSPGIEVIKDTIVPNVSSGTLPIVSAFTQLFRERTASYNTESLVNTSVEKSATQVRAELSSIAKMSVSALNLFFDPWESLIREMIRRMKRRDYDAREPGGKYIADLRKRLLQRGSEGVGAKDRYLQAFYELDIDRLRITKPVGAGSEAARMVAFDRLMGIFGSLPDSGKQNLVWDIVSETAGYENAGRYAIAPGETETPTWDASLAQVENNQLLQGGQIQVIDGQNDLVHAKVHLTALEPLVGQAQEALAVDPMSVADLLPGLNNLNQHMSEHVARLGQDPMMREQSAFFRKALQNADEILHNGTLKVQKLMGEQQAMQEEAAMQQAIGGGVEQQGPQVSPEVLAKIEAMRAERQAKLEMDFQQHQQRMLMRQQDNAQKMALRDAETASKIQRQGIRF